MSCGCNHSKEKAMKKGYNAKRKSMAGKSGGGMKSGGMKKPMKKMGRM
jgi:hypothetical protein